MTNVECRKATGGISTFEFRHSSFGFRHSFVILISSFDI